MTFNSNYYSIDEIFITQEKIPCRSLQMMRKMGFLDVGSCSEDLPERKEVDLPLWYCQAIDNSRNQTIWKINIPEIYLTIYTDICKADATVVPLGKFNKYFYEFGRNCSKFDRTGEVSKLLYETCKTRMKHLKDVCCNDQVSDVKATHELEFLEQELYKIGSQQMQKFNKWLQDESNTAIVASEIVINHRKRRREENQSDDIL